MYKIQKDVPFPKAQNFLPPIRRKYPFEELEVGAMFFVPDRKKNNLAQHASTVGRKLGRQFATRLLKMLADPAEEGGWLPCEDPNDPKGVLGIGVWRRK